MNSTEKLFTAVKLFLEDSPNSKKLYEVLDVWEFEVYNVIFQNVVQEDDVSTFLCMESTGLAMTIRHEIDGLRNIQFLRAFYNMYTEMNSALDQFNQISEIIETSTALTISIYLVLGPEIDFGVSFHQPLSSKQLSGYLNTCPEQDAVERWLYENNNPIATAISFSFMKTWQEMTFYIFDEERDANFKRAFSLFDCLGIPLTKELISKLKLSKADENNCRFSYTDDMVETISLEMRKVEPKHALEIGDCLDTDFNRRKWIDFQRTLEGEKLITFSLTKDGYLMYQTVHF